MRRLAIAGAALVALLLAGAAVAAASGWSIEKTPNRKGFSDSRLFGVSCTSPKACIAVGAYYAFMTPGTLAERWNGSKWSIQTTRKPKGSSGSQLNGVSCVSASACTAVGEYFTSHRQVTLAERWNGSKWSIEHTPNPKGGSTIELDGVSCRSARACTAVGFYFKGSTVATLAERWNGTRWSIEHTPNPKGVVGIIDLFGVSCSAARACMAVGYYYNGSSYPSLAERWNGTKWSIEPTPNPTGSAQTVLAGVSCLSAHTCTAVGSWEDGSRVTLAERWNGSKWSIQATPNPTGATRSELLGVSCTAADACTATGDYYGSAQVTLAERWNGTKWSTQVTPNPTGATDVWLQGVSCASVRECTAVGYYFTASRTPTLAERWKGGG